MGGPKSKTFAKLSKIACDGNKVLRVLRVFENGVLRSHGLSQPGCAMGGTKSKATPSFSRVKHNKKLLGLSLPFKSCSIG